MELGAVICVPNGQAKCAECPIAFTCLAHRHDKEDMIPVKAPKKARTQDNRTVFYHSGRRMHSYQEKT